MSRRLLVLALAAVFVGLSAASVFADDLNPPPWRGQPGTTFALWQFLTPDPNPQPDMLYNPYGIPWTHVVPGIGQNWWSFWGGRQGVWPFSGSITVGIPNRPGGEYKDIWVQITWAQQAINESPIVRVGNVFGSDVHKVPLGPTNEPYGDGIWWHSTYTLRLYPNPPYEEVVIDGAIMVDQLVIDTICIPEPSSLLALSGGVVGLVGFVIRRRR